MKLSLEFFKLVFLILTPLAVKASDSPNILFFLVDDMGIGDSSVPFLYSYKGDEIEMPLNRRYRTPNMERLARLGRKFTRAHAYSVCTPTRASLMTGQSAERQRITTWTHPQKLQDTGAYQKNGLVSAKWQMQGVDTQVPTLPKLLAGAGYRTIHCGKAHFGPNAGPAGDPCKIGFQVNIAGHGGGGPGSYWGEKNFSAKWRNGSKIWDVPNLEKYHGTPTNLTEALTLELKDELERTVKESRSPFFAYMAHYAVHAPFEADARFTQNYPDLKGKALAFATMVEGMDKSLGDLLDHLELLGVAEETLVVFYSDNGSDGPPNLPLRGIKGTRFEGGDRVPMIVAWAKPNPEHPMQKRLKISPDSRDDRLVVPMDFLPSLLRVAGVPLPPGKVFDGHDITPMMEGIPGTHGSEEFVVHFPHGRHRNEMFSSMLFGDNKIIYEYATKSWQFTNLAYDPFEKENLISRQPRAALLMAERLVKRLGERGASFPRDATTGKPVKPNLEPLRKALERHETRSFMPLDGDDLDLASLLQPVAPENIYGEKDYFCWCNSLIKGTDGRYHLFYVRWPKKYGFLAWLTHSEIARAVSDRPTGPYQFVERIIPNRGEHAWNEFNAHNVKVKKFGDNYYLYFIATNGGAQELGEAELLSVARGGYRHAYWRSPLRNNQRVGVAVADQLEGPWKVMDHPVVEPHGPIATVTVNPAIWERSDGTFRMIVKGDGTNGRPVQALAESDSPLGPFFFHPTLVFEDYSEDVSVWQDSARGLIYGILHDGKGFGLIASKDGTQWRRAKNFRVIGKTVERIGDDALEIGRFERPSVFVEEGVPSVLSAAARLKGGKDSKIILIPLKVPEK